MKDLSHIRKALTYSKSGSLSNHLKILITCGFVSQYSHWSIKTGAAGRQSLYRLSDNYLRFYVKYIEPNYTKIQNNSYEDFNLTHLPGWEAMMGLQVENLILKNRNILLKMLGLDMSNIVSEGPYIQKSNKTRPGCQIDYLIQTHSKNLYICEFKFKKRELGTEIIESMQDKISRLKVPKGLGICPVLLHLSGVTHTVYEQKYFYRIIDIADFFS